MLRTAGPAVQRACTDQCAPPPHTLPHARHPQPHLVGAPAWSCPLSPPAGGHAPAASGCGAIVPAAPPTAAATRACRAAGSSAAAATGALAAWGKLWPSVAASVAGERTRRLWRRGARGRRATKQGGCHALCAASSAVWCALSHTKGLYQTRCHKMPLPPKRHLPIFWKGGRGGRPFAAANASREAREFVPAGRSLLRRVKAAERMLRRAVGPRKKRGKAPVLEYPPRRIGLWIGPAGRRARCAAPARNCWPPLQGWLRCTASETLADCDADTAAADTCGPPPSHRRRRVAAAAAGLMRPPSLRRAFAPC